MRITIGGVLLGAGLGASVAYFVMDPSRLGMVQTKLNDTFPGVMSLVGLRVTPEPEKKDEAYNPPPPFPASGTAPANTVSSATTPPLDVAMTPMPEPTPTPLVVEEKKAPAVSVSKRRSRRKSVRAKPVVAAPVAKAAVKKKTTRAPRAPAAKTAPTPAPQANLTGRYVSLELITGRSVQGIYQGRTATHHILNVPGLGPLEYPIDNVKSVQSAE